MLLWLREHLTWTYCTSQYMHFTALQFLFVFKNLIIKQKGRLLLATHSQRSSMGNIRSRQSQIIYLLGTNRWRNTIHGHEEISNHSANRTVSRNLNAIRKQLSRNRLIYIHIIDKIDSSWLVSTQNTIQHTFSSTSSL